MTTEYHPLLDAVKLSLRITTSAFDDELDLLIQSAEEDLGIAGVVVPEDSSAAVKVAIITYCRMRFGQPDEYDRLKASYDEQKAQLSMHTGTTRWTGVTRFCS